ncbi:MAG TPA: zeta toxin family protein [Lacunisphaera sp.]|nr:zeta toxin family protein [Lacunisphaera sp.]
MNPIYEALKEKQRFHFALLAGEVEDLKLYWDWWWSQQDFTKIDYPLTLADDDPILIPTSKKGTVDTQSGADFFDKFLKNSLAKKILPSGPAVPRADFQNALIRNFMFLAPKNPEPEAIIVGGGYGSGKTTVLDHMRLQGCFPFTAAAALGVDNFKLFMPEFEQIRMVCDGRASATVQEECKNLSRILFANLVSDRRTFAWDASMSSGGEAHSRLQMLKDSGYKLTFIAVFTPLETAIRLAMLRAKEGRRFIEPGLLEASHKSFLSHFPSYLDYFHEIKVFYNNPSKSGPTVTPTLIAEATGPNNSLVIYNRDTFDSFIPP